MARIQSHHFHLLSSATAAAVSATFAFLALDLLADSKENGEHENCFDDSTGTSTDVSTAVVRRMASRHLWWRTPSTLRIPSLTSRCDDNRIGTTTTATTTTTTTTTPSRFPTWTSMDRSARFSKRLSASVSVDSRLADLYQVHWDTPLGEGGFGAVYSATDQSTGERVACKQMSKQYTDNVAFQREMEAFLHLREHGGHPNICSLRETFDEGGDYYLILDLILGGEMFDHLIKHGAYSEADAARLMREIASALAFLHGTGCVHGDLKPENLMLSTRHASDAVVKLIDFGCAQLAGREDIPASDVKTEAYSPPEVLKRELELLKQEKARRGKTNCSSESRSLDPSMDMWALGVILYIMLTGFHPFDMEGNSPDSLIARRIINNSPFPIGAHSPYTAHLSESASDLILKLLAYDAGDRITALEMLDHPWVRGLTARKDKITDIDKKLSKFRAFKSGLEAKVFTDLFNWSEDSSDMATKNSSLIERSFHAFDEEHKGFLTGKDLKRRLQDGTTVDDSDEETLTLSNFEELLSESMKSKYFPRGHVIYHEGHEGHEMFFINSGVVEVSTKDGFRTQLKQGDFFGEGALLSSNRTRSATLHCVTPVHVISITREHFEKYLSASNPDINLKIREKVKTRMVARTKAILRQQKGLIAQEVDKNTPFYNIGDDGDKIFIIEKGKVDVKTADGTTVFTVDRGGLFGERAVMASRPRTTTAICASTKCLVQVMNAEAFHQVLQDSPCLGDSLTNVSRRREFQRAVVFYTKQPFPTTTEALREVFDLVDADKSGMINLDEIRSILKNMDPSTPEEEIRGVLEALDIDESSVVNFEEFKLLFGMDLRARPSI